MIIKDVYASKIINSRGEKTISVVVETFEGKFEASAPSGKSRGKNEAEPFSSKGIDASVHLINMVGKKLSDETATFFSFYDLSKIESIIGKIDKTENLRIIGGNAVFALEAAVLKALAKSYKKPLWEFLNPNPKIIPMPLGNCIGGGKHVSQDKKTNFQEFLLLPQTKNFSDAYMINLESYKNAKKMISEKDLEWEGNLTDEKAIATTLGDEEVLEIIKELSEKIRKDFKINIGIGIDMAASSLWNGTHYAYENSENNKKLTPDEQIAYVLELIEKHNLFYVEDPLEEEDFEGFAKLLKKLNEKNSKCLVVGDDLVCTQYERLKKAVQKKSINAVIIKPNQNGSILDTKRIVDFAHENKIKTIISHRSGETMDSTIAHLAVGWQIPIIKTGILGRERLAKLNEIVKIERMLKKKSR